MARRLWSPEILMLALLTLLAPTAHASGFFAPDTGLRALGRGSAFVAGADDLSAMYFNPGALTRLDRPQIMYTVAAVSQPVTFDRLDEGDVVFDPVENEASPFIVPNFGFATKFGLPDTTFAIGLFTPIAPKFDYADDGPQRYALRAAQYYKTNFGPTVAHRFDWFSIGAGVYWSVLGAIQDLTITTTKGDDPETDIGAALEAWDWFALNWNVGLLAEPTDWLAIGAAFSPPVKYEASGSLTTDMSQHAFYTSGMLADETSTAEDILLKITMPMQIQGGIAVRPIEALELEADFFYYHWSVVQEFLITDVELVLSPAPGNALGVTEDIVADDDVVLPVGLKNAWSARFGAEYDINDVFIARAGGLYDKGAMPLKNLSNNLLDGDKFGYSAGATIRPWDRWAFDLAWSHQFLERQEVKNSEYKQVYVELDLADLSATEITEGNVVANGLYESQIMAAGVGVTHYFKGKQ